jgi:hypothetical protein
MSTKLIFVESNLDFLRPHHKNLPIYRPSPLHTIPTEIIEKSNQIESRSIAKTKHELAGSKTVCSRARMLRFSRRRSVQPRPSRRLRRRSSHCSNQPQNPCDISREVQLCQRGAGSPPAAVCRSVLMGPRPDCLDMCGIHANYGLLVFFAFKPEASVSDTSLHPASLPRPAIQRR